MSYVDEYSWRGLYGPQAKDIIQTKDMATWTVQNKRKGVLFSNDIDTNLPNKIFYATKEQVKIISQKHKIKKERIHSVCYELQKVVNISGKKNRGLRNRINRYEDKIKILNNFQHIDDIIEFCDIWKNDYSLKYFANYVGRNRFFYDSNYHKDCFNVFLYDDSRLIGMGTASLNTYIIGKALYKEYTGLSEFLDLMVYRKVYKNGGKIINLGMSGTSGLTDYKKKFPSAFIQEEYNVTIKI